MDATITTTTNQENLLGLMKELTATQVTLAKLDAQLALSQAKDQVNSIIDTTRENLKQQAKQCKVDLNKFTETYKKNSESKSGILEDYKQALDDVNSYYNSVFTNILEKKAQLEADEQDTILKQSETKNNLKEAKKQFPIQEKNLKNEIKKAVKEGDLDTAQEKLSELQELYENSPVDEYQTAYEGLDTRRKELRKAIEDCENEFNRALEQRNNMLNMLKDGKNVSLANLPKQSFLQKMLGAVLNRFNKTKTFMKNAIDPLKAKIATIKNEDIPRIKESVEKNKKDFTDKVVSKRRAIEAKVTDTMEQCATKLSKSKQKVIDTFGDIKNFAVDKAADVKENIGEKVDSAKKFAGQVKDNIITRKDKIVKGAQNLVTSVVDGAQNVKDSVTTHVTSTISNVQTSFRNTIDKGKQLKLDLISKAQTKLKDNQKEIEAKREVLNGKNQQDNAEPEL